MKQPPELPIAERRQIEAAQRLVEQNQPGISRAMTLFAERRGSDLAALADIGRNIAATYGGQVAEAAQAAAQTVEVIAGQQAALAELGRQVAELYSPQLAGLQSSLMALADSLIPPQTIGSLVPGIGALVDGWPPPDFWDALRPPEFMQQFAGLKLNLDIQISPALTELASLFTPAWKTQALDLIRAWPENWWSTDHWFPDNWPEDRLDLTAKMAIDAGVPIVGFPATSVVNDMLDAYERGDDPDRILDAHAVDIIDDLGAFAHGLDDTDPMIEDAVHTFRELIANYRDGRTRTVQSSAFSVAEHLYRTLTGASRVRAEHLRRQHIVIDVGALAVSELPLSVALHVFATAYGAWYPEDKEVPRQLNRQASAHTPSAHQHTAGNALRVLLLLANLFHLHVSRVPA